VRNPHRRSDSLDRPRSGRSNGEVGGGARITAVLRGDGRVSRYNVSVEEMDGDEVLALIASGLVGLFAAARWYAGLLRVTSLGASAGGRVVLALTPIGCLALVHAVLVSWSAREVRTDPRYVLLFLTAAAAWLGVAGWLFGLLGVSARDDVLEGRNAAAAWAVGGGLLGTALCYAGCYIGEDPSIWTTFATAGAATAVLLALWFLLELTAGCCSHGDPPPHAATHNSFIASPKEP